MQNLNKLHLLQLLFLHVFAPPSSKSQEIPVSRCGSTVIQEPFVAQNPTNSSILNHMILCNSGKLYFRTTIGLFPVSSIDYLAKLLTVSHTGCSSTSNFISPYHLSAGFPLTPSSNSVILLNCSKKVHKIPSSSCDNHTRTFDHGCGNSSVKGLFSCLALDEFESLGKSFDPYKEMDCTHYRRVYRNGDRLEMGTQIRFDIPDHVPNPCDQCEKPYGNCGVGLRCICHPRKCKDKVISVGAVLDPIGNIIFSMFFFIVMMETL
ncbi:uncharacterized protein LOC142538802 [Primulina tabacum]|uniref:uncharacterized protein LOC142538802 n=1 Tax=Primulina tabacum TaxID=48773 RepID=UPI003F59B169